MPILDLIIKAKSDPMNVPYYVTSPAKGQRRNRIQAGEVVTFRDQLNHPGKPLDGYGVIPLLSRNWRIIRVSDALPGDGEMLVGEDVLSPADELKGFLPRARVWRIKINELPTNIKNEIVPRRFPDVDHQFFIDHPVVRARLISKFPGIDTLPGNLRRSTPWDIEVTRAQLVPFFRQKQLEPRDLSGFPEDDLETDQEIDIGDNIR